MFAIGAFSAFSLSQIGMVAHWRRKRGKYTRTKLAVNAAGATMTSIALVIVIVAKFVECAWIMLIIWPGLVWMFWKIKHHYEWIARVVDQPVKLQTGKLRPPVVVIHIDTWNRVTERALRFGMEMSDEITALRVTTDKDNTESLRKTWAEKVESRRAPRRPPCRSWRSSSHPIDRFTSRSLNLCGRRRRKTKTASSR